MDEVLKRLRDKEKELEEVLSQNPDFINLESLRVTISLFENGSSENSHQTASQLNDIPISYNGQLSWRERLLFVINKLKSAFASEIIVELKRLGETQTDEFLNKRVGVMLSSMKKKRIIGVRTVDKKFKYFIK